MSFSKARVNTLLFAAPPILWLVLLNCAPLVEMVRVSFLSRYPYQEHDQVSYSIVSYLTFLSNNIYGSVLLYTLIFALSVTALTLIIMYPVAYFIARKVPLARRTKIILLFLLPFWTGDIVRNFAIMILLGNRGAINLILLNLGVIDRPLSLLFNNFSLSLGVFYSSSIFMLLPLYSAIEKLPKSLHEAASDLGAGSIDRFFNITLPLTRDGVVSACVLSFLINVGSYATPLMLSGPENRLFSQIIAYYFSTTEGQWNIGAAYAVILSLTALLTAAFIMWLGGSRRRVR